MKSLLNALRRRNQATETVPIQSSSISESLAIRDDAKFAKLFDLLENPPTNFHDQNSWTTETALLITALFVERVDINDLATIFAGLLSYRKCGLTSHNTQLALIRAYCKTNGLAQELLHRMLFGTGTTNKTEEPSILFGKFSPAERSQVLQALRDTGYAVLPKRLPQGTVRDLCAATLNMHYDLRGNERRLDRISKIDPNDPPRCSIADAVDADVWGNPLFASLIHDQEIIGLIEEHLNAPVTPIAAPLRYTFPSTEASSDGAQLFHYDLDTLRWLKVFYYLNDIDEEHGPHVYVEGTHRPGAKSAEMLQRLYERLPDEEFEHDRHGPVRTACGSAGTVIIGDTRCFHKGLNVHKGHRLLFFPLYAPSSFGMNHGVR